MDAGDRGYVVVRIGIVGSRTYANLDAVRAFVRSLPVSTIVVTGGARGVDRAAEDTARTIRLSRIILEPQAASSATYTTYAQACLARNRRIVEESDEIYAFWDGKSRGTKYTIDYAEKLGKKVTVIR